MFGALAGFYCDKGSLTPVDVQKICPKGKYCPEGTAEPIPCSGGTYQPREGATSCIVCPQGRPKAVDAFQSYPQTPYKCRIFKNVFLFSYTGSFCTVGSTQPQPCPIGFYCPSGTQHEYQYPCPQGTFGKVQGATSVESCQLCEGGQMCNTLGTGTQGGNAMTNCPAGQQSAAGFPCFVGAETFSVAVLRPWLMRFGRQNRETND